MKLKGFGKRLHNIFFHTHTVAGIVISFGLFIIFFAGAFALFMDEVYRWENPDARYETPSELDIDRAFQNAIAISPNIDLSNNISVVLPTKYNPELKVYANEITQDSTTRRVSVSVNTHTYEATSFEEKKTHMIETLYHLHYFDYIPYGIYISGLVALFFLFATITGVLIHWKDVIEKFYALRTRNGLKNLWKDAHTTLSLIGLPFQLIYGISGALLGLSILLLAPSVVILFDGSQDNVRAMLDPFFEVEVARDAPKSDNIISLNEAKALADRQYGAYGSFFLRLRNYGTEKAAVAVRYDDRSTLTGDGTVVVDMQKGKIINALMPGNKGYKGSYGLLIRLHYATYGDIWMKIIYFLLSMLTCFIIVSGILLWQSARDNKKYTDQQRRFHHRVTKAYLNICFSLFPAVVVLFIANMVVPFDMLERIHNVDYAFFCSWLILLVCGYFYDSYRDIIRYYLILGAGLGLLIPVANGWVTGDWLWSTITQKQWQVALVDISWIVISTIILLAVYTKQNKGEKYHQL